MNLARVPTLLSITRLISAIALYLIIFLEYPTLFFIIFVLAGITDFFDGYLARKWHVQSARGARFDSIADYAFFGSIPVWIAISVPYDVLETFFLPFALVATMTLIYVLVRIVSHHSTFYHLWSAKSSAVVAYIVALLIFSGYHEAWPIWLAVSVVIIAELEELATLTSINAMPKVRR